MALVVVVWFGISGVGGPLFGQLASVQENDNASFLPASAESTEVVRRLEAFADRGAASTLPVTVAFERADGAPLTPADLAAIASSIQRAVAASEVAKTIAEVDVAPGVRVPSVFPATPEQAPAALSANGRAYFTLINLDTEKLEALGSFEEIPLVVDQITEQVAEPNAHVRGYVTGAGGFFAELGRAFEGIDEELLLTTLAVVAVILLLVYRSPLLWILPLISGVFALSLSIIFVYNLAKNGVLDLNGQSQGILFVLVLGAATDYALLIVARYREELTLHEDKYAAMRAAIKGAWEPIAASAGTVIAGLLMLLLSDLSSNASLGPVAAVGIVAAFVTSLTFLPAALLLFGRRIFWPFIPRYGDTLRQERALWGRIASYVGRRPRSSWIAVSLLLVVAAGFVSTLKAEGLSTADTFTNQNNQAVVGLRILERNGLIPPTPEVTVVGEVGQIEALRDAAAGVDNVAIATVRTTADATGQQQILTADGVALLDVTLANDIDNSARLATVPQLREELKAVSASAIVGGEVAVDYDVQQASARDRAIIIPAALAVITLILMLLLRSILAPILLLATTVLSFGSALGISALLFNEVFGFAGADTSFPLFAFVFLVALGIDYNIFLMTRAREESVRMGTRAGTLKALTVTGGVITSAGVVLAATFAALAVIPIVFLAQVGVTVALGVLLDTFIVRSLLVPALVHDIGPKVWWPSKLARAEQPVS